jgi:hypothetical protein
VEPGGGVAGLGMRAASGSRRLALLVGLAATFAVAAFVGDGSAERPAGAPTEAAPEQALAEGLLARVVAATRAADASAVCAEAEYQQSCRSRFRDEPLTSFDSLPVPSLQGTRVEGRYRVLELCVRHREGSVYSDFPVALDEGRLVAVMPDYSSGSRWALNPSEPVGATNDPAPVDCGSGASG